jgi:hypothetical protein
MKTHRLLTFLVAIMLLTSLASVAPRAPVLAAPAAQGAVSIHLKPDRVLVVSGIQMQDSNVIHNSYDLGDVVALLKLWGVPFDILRLDTHAMALSDFADGSNND